MILSKYEHPKNFYNVKLYLPCANMKELSGNNTLESYNVKSLDRMVLTASIAFAWDPLKKGDGIKLSNSNLVANKSGGSAYQCVLSDIGFTTGRHYWEIKIDKYVDYQDLIIGVAQKDIDCCTYPVNSHKFWGYFCLCSQKVGPLERLDNYGFSCNQGDIVGVYLQFDQNRKASLSFFKNGVNCGVAFKAMRGELFPVVTMFYGEVQVTLNAKAQMPIMI